MRVVFAGSPEFALPSLEALAASPHELLAVITQPDRPRGRKLMLAPPPVKVKALELNLPVLQPENINDPGFFPSLDVLKPDWMVVVAFGQILKPAVLEWPRLGCVNVHASLLPKYRGAAPIQHAILNGEKTTGVSFMKLDPGMDTGPVYFEEALEIGPDETAGDLSSRLARLGAGFLIWALKAIEFGGLAPIPQDNALATCAPPLKKEMARIAWDQPADKAHNLVRALNPNPVAFSLLENRRIRILRTSINSHEKSESSPGIVMDVNPEKGLMVACGLGSLWVEQLQPEGRNPMTGYAFSLGHGAIKGKIFN